MTRQQAVTDLTARVKQLELELSFAMTEEQVAELTPALNAAMAEAAAAAVTRYEVRGIRHRVFVKPGRYRAVSLTSANRATTHGRNTPHSASPLGDAWVSGRGMLKHGPTVLRDALSLICRLDHTARV